MKVLVCGSRHFYDWRTLEQILYELNKEEKITDIIHGHAAGADMVANQWAMYNNLRVWSYPAKWEEHGKAAGPIRNKQMLVEGKPDLVIAFLSPSSIGTKDMIYQATKANIPIRIINI